MSRMQVASFNDVKIYNLSAGKAVPQWLPERQRRNLAKDENYRRRVELIQDLEFPTACQRIKMSPDCQYVVTAGTYPPAVRVYDVQEMSMKFERRLTSEVVDFLILSEDAGKLLFLQNDRTLAFHAPYGAHYSLRIPTFGRSLGYHPPSCDVYIAASKDEVYRLNLEEGRFHAPLVVRSTQGVNCLALNPVHMLLATGGADGSLEFVDPRSQESLTVMDMTAALASSTSVRDSVQVTALEYDRDGLTYGVGTSSGHCLLYDLRSARPLVVKEHQYSLPIRAIRFHGLSRKVLSCDPKIVKIWEREATTGSGKKEAGAILTNIETTADLNDICMVSDKRGESGLMLMAGEQERVMTYYVPALGPAPKWCSFLDTITEELEEEESTAVYDDYKFVTRQEVDELRATDLIGTPLLRGYMHGFFMDMNLYQKLEAVSEPFAFEEWRKKKMREKIEAKRASRISLQKKLPKVNRALAERLLRDSKAGEEEKDAAAANPLSDDRFKKMFTSEDFEVDEEAEDFKLRHPSGVAKGRRGRRGEGESDDELVVEENFREVEPGDDDDDDDDEEEDEDQEVEYAPDSLARAGKREAAMVGKKKVEQGWGGGKDKSGRQKQQQKTKKRPRFMEMEEVQDGGDGPAMMMYDRERVEQAKERRDVRKVPLAERVGRGGGRSGGREAFRGKLVRDKQGMVREFTYYPMGRGGAGRGAKR